MNITSMGETFQDYVSVVDMGFSRNTVFPVIRFSP